MRTYLPLILILLAYLVISTLYAIYTPAWQAPDEPAHYNYVRQVADGRLPVMAPGDYDETTKNEIVSSRFAAGYSIDSFTYEDWQPPLYYLLQAPVFQLSGGSLLALRLVSLLFGAGVVMLAYSIGIRLRPERQWVGLTTAVFIAFLPQHIAIMASVNNDSLAELLIGGILLGLMAIGDRELEGRDWSPETERRYLLLLGVLLGLGFVTKGTVYLMAPVVASVLWWRYRGQGRQLGRAGLWVAVPALFLGALWWGRNLVLYGGVDLLGKQAHDAVVVGQPRTSEWVAAYGLEGTIGRFLQTSFNSFWGQFGWMALPMTHPSWLYPLLGLFTALVVVGLLLQWIRYRFRFSAQAAILLGTFLLTVALHVGYNLTFVQHQGRYLFPALIPIGVGVAVGLGSWATLFRRWSFLPELIPPGLAAALIGLDLWALFRIIVPNL